MSLSFLSETENQELIQRIILAQLGERDRHKRRESEIYSDHLNRGLSKSTVCFGAIWSEALGSQSKLATITIDQIFYPVQEKRARLADRHIAEIVEMVELGFVGATNQLEETQLNQMRERGLVSSTAIGSMARMHKHTTAEALQSLVCEVRTRAGEWERARKRQDKQKFWKAVNQLPKWWPIILAITSLVVVKYFAGY